VVVIDITLMLDLFIGVDTSLLTCTKISIRLMVFKLTVMISMLKCANIAIFTTVIVDESKTNQITFINNKCS